MAGEPIKPKSAGEVSSAQKRRSAQGVAAAGSAVVGCRGHRRLCRQGARDVAAPGRCEGTAGVRARRHHEPAADLGHGLRAAGRHVSRGGFVGSLDIRLVYYRGLNECRATGWISDSAQLAKLMSKIDCQGGNTQIGKVLSEARREAVASAVRAVVFVGDAMEEAVDDLCAKAGELGLLKVPVFMFQEGHDATAEQAFREIARLTGGAWCRFDPGAAAQLRELLRAAAAYAAGGREALLRLSKTGSGAAKLIGQMK